MSLTHVKIAAAKPQEKPYKLADAQQLYLVIQPSGAKLWRLNYRHAGRQKTLHLGPWPALGIADARAKRDEVRAKVANGEDPAAAKRIERLTAIVNAANSFEAVAEEWIAKCEREGRADITLSKIRWLLGMAYPLIGQRPVSEVTPQEALAVLRVVESSGRYESARRMRSVISRVFRYAIATTRADRDPSADLRGALTTPRVKHLPDFYENKDHLEVAQAVRSMQNIRWLVSYDDVLPIQEMYSGAAALQYTIGYSARNVLRGREAMFFSDGLTVPEVEGSMVELHRAGAGEPLIPAPQPRRPAKVSPPAHP